MRNCKVQVDLVYICRRMESGGLRRMNSRTAYGVADYVDDFYAHFWWVIAATSES
jgi:hypothetical protein